MAAQKPTVWYPAEKVCLMIDGANAHSAAKVLGFNIDWTKMHQSLSQKCRLSQAIYYTKLWLENDDETNARDFSPLQPLLDYLNYNGFRTVTKDTKEYQREDGATIKVGNIAVEFAVDLVEYSRRMDRIVIFAGNPDYTYAIQRAQESGCRIVAISALKTCSDILRRQVNDFIDLASIINEIKRDG